MKRSIARFVLLAVVALLTMLPPAASAQFPLPVPAASSSANPYGFPIRRVAGFDTASITFEGVRLFTIAAPVSSDPNAVPPIVQRVDAIQENLRRIVPLNVNGNWFAPPASRFDPNTFKVEIGSENGYATLYATDANKKDIAPIMTLTEADAALYAMPTSDLASQWQATLQTALGPAVLAAQPDYMREQVRKLPFVLIGAVLVTGLLSYLRRYLSDKLDAVAGRAQAFAGETIESPERKRLRSDRRVLGTVKWLTDVLVLVLWLYVVLMSLSIFPPTRVFARELSSQIMRVVALWVGVFVLDRLLTLLLARVADAWEGNPFLPPHDRARQVLRQPTILSAAENLKALVLYAIAIGLTFSILRINTTSVLTISAVVAFAVSFAAQSLIKDFVNGFLILAEDQFAIGDRITINGTTGVVENLTLRITQIRTDDGRLVTMPNSSIVAVENSTRSWSRIDFRVAVANDTDIAKASELLQKALDDVAADPAWSSKILEPPKVLGVDSVSNSGIVLRAWVKTAPYDKGAVSREINQRVDEAFRSNAVNIALPQTVLVQPQVSAVQTPEA